MLFYAICNESRCESAPEHTYMQARMQVTQIQVIQCAVLSDTGSHDQRPAVKAVRTVPRLPRGGQQGDMRRQWRSR